MTASLRIGILGGTFDPIHEGHLALAKAACDQLKLDRLIFVPACTHPFESKRLVLASPEERLDMTRLAAASKPKFEVSDVELKRGGVSYTVDTLRHFRKQYPAPNELFFITGGDWGKNLSQWKEIDTIFSLAYFVVARRPGFDTSGLSPKVRFLDFVPLDISSTAIRDALKKGKPLEPVVSKPVLDYIQKHRLYS